MVAEAREFSIGQLARATGTHLETVRYYERIGLMPAPARTGGGHRSYTPAQVRRLAFIRHARELGFAIDAIRTLLALSEPAHRSCAEVREIAGAHLLEVRTKLAHLKRLERILSGTIDQCSGEPIPACPVLDMLGTKTGL